MTTRDWKFLVWKSTATSLSTALVDFTIDNAHLAGVPVITGSRVRPLEGRIEARPWTVNVLDSSSFFTKQIGDSGGRLDLLNRFVQARLSIDGSTYAPVAGGRLVDAINADNIATWQMTVQDEWLAGAETQVFTTNTTLLYPPRPLHGYKGIGEGYAAVGTATRIVVNASTAFTKRKLWLVSLHAGGGGAPPLPDISVNFIRSDLLSTSVGLSTAGSFRYLRFRSGGTDYKVVGFKTNQTQITTPTHPNAHPFPDPEDHLFNSDELRNHQSNGGPLNFWVAASSTAFGGTGSKTFQLSDAVSLHAMTAPPSEATPLHIWPGWSSGNPYGTVHPMQVLKDILDGVYSSSSESLPYYSTESFTGTKDIRRLTAVGVAFRITQTDTLRNWVTDNLLAPHGVVGLGDARGKVAFKSILQADPQLGYSTSNLYSFTSTNLRLPHPDWRTSRREQVTQVKVNAESINRSGMFNTGQPRPGGPNVAASGNTIGGDGISAKTVQASFNHDRVARYGTFPVTYNFAGYGYVGDLTPTAFPQWLTDLQYYGQYYTKKVFDRYGDGPIQGTLYALPGASTVQPGDFAKLTLGSFPNPAAGGARGGTRLVQILTKDITPEGYAYEYLDAGGQAAPLTSPTLTLSSSTLSPKFAVKVTVSGGVPSGGGVQLFMAESATTVAPTSTSAAWHPVYTTTPLVTATGSYLLPRLKSGTRFFVCGQAQASNAPYSARSTPVTKVTASITSPSALTMSNLKAQTVDATWTLGDVAYPLDFHVDDSTSATPTTANRVFRLIAGTDRASLANLTPSQKYRSWVRHADPYGGFSGFDSTTFTMTSTATTSNVKTAPALGGLYTVFGST